MRGLQWSVQDSKYVNQFIQPNIRTAKYKSFNPKIQLMLGKIIFHECNQSLLQCRKPVPLNILQWIALSKYTKGHY